MFVNGFTEAVLNIEVVIFVFIEDFSKLVEPNIGAAEEPVLNADWLVNGDIPIGFASPPPNIDVVDVELNIPELIDFSVPAE